LDREVDWKEMDEGTGIHTIKPMPILPELMNLKVGSPDDMEDQDSDCLRNEISRHKK
jgi:hypothetical protein